MSTLKDSRVSKIICERGRCRNGGLYTPTFRETKPHIYLDVDNYVFFNPDLLKNDEIKEIKTKDLGNFFKEFHINT